MVRAHFLTAWSVVFLFLAAAGLFAAEAKEPKPKQAKAPAAKAAPQRQGGPVARPAKPVAPPPRPAAKQLRPGENVARIEAALAAPTEMCFTETPLQEVLDYLKEKHQIEIQIDEKALGDAGIGADSPVTIDVKGITLRSALNLMLRKLNLTWTIEDEVLMITTPDEADSVLTTQVYDVADLVVCRDEHDVIYDDYDSLIDVITETIKPTTWDNTGGPASIAGASLGTAKVLVVTQTRAAHEAITELLAKIREVAKKTPNLGPPRRNRPAPPKGLSGGRAMAGAGSSSACPGRGAPAGASPPTQKK